MTDGRFYWLKLKRDFFKRHDIAIVEDMPNGKDYVLFYLKLLCESVDHEGNLRFSDQIPYNENMLATITHTNVDIVRSAIHVFSQLNMMELMDDGTYYMSEVQNMIGSAADNDNANRQRRFRENKKKKALQDRYGSVTENNESKSKSIELDTDHHNNIDHHDDDVDDENDDLDAKKVTNDSYTDEFESIWKDYPNKQGKHNALKAFIKARKEGVPLEMIENGLKRYRDHVEGTDKRYIKHGDTWFRGRYWEDDGIQEEDRETDLDDIFM